MNRRTSLFCLFQCLVLAAMANAQQETTRPVTGKVVERFAGFDPVIDAHMDHIGATAASFAVSLNGKVVYSRAFGWSDGKKTIPATPESTFRLASNTKPIAAAIIRRLIAKKKHLNLSTKVFSLLDIQPLGGELGDERLSDITIEHLLAHRGGWDRSTTFDPTYRPKTISKAHSIEVADLTKEHIVSYMLAKPLQYEPSEKYAYSNLGYILLGLIIENETETSFAENVVEFSARLKADIRISATQLEDRHQSEVHYPRESGLVIPLRDSLGGLTGSAESMCKFMKKYWTNGKPRKKKERRGVYHTGTHRRSTNALIEQRKDGVDYALIFNACRDKGYKDDLKKIRSATTVDQPNFKATNVGKIIDARKNKRGC